MPLHLNFTGKAKLGMARSHSGFAGHGNNTGLGSPTPQLSRCGAPCQGLARFGEATTRGWSYSAPQLSRSGYAWCVRVQHRMVVLGKSKQRQQHGVQCDPADFTARLSMARLSQARLGWAKTRGLTPRADFMVDYGGVGLGQIWQGHTWAKPVEVWSGKVKHGVLTDPAAF